MAQGKKQSAGQKIFMTGWNIMKFILWGILAIIGCAIPPFGILLIIYIIYKIFKGMDEIIERI